LAISAVAVALGNPAMAAHADAKLENLTGRWENLAGDDGKAAIHRAIDEGIEPMSFVTEPIARGRLRDNNPPIPHLRIEPKGDALRVRFGSSHAYRAPVGGEAVAAESPDGEDVKVTHRMRGDALVQRVTAGNGHSTMLFRPVAGGQRLKVTMIIKSSHLPRDIEYTLRFKRAD
jgi:hypothetical protein